MGIVLPDGVLGNPAAEYIRWWIMRETQVLASVDLPVEAFIAEANVNILTSLLFLRRKSEEENAPKPWGIDEYPVFMAVADKVGFDRRGNKLYKRSRMEKKSSSPSSISNVSASVGVSWNGP